MNQNMNQKPKSDALKIALIIIFSVLGVILVGIVGVVFLIYTIFNKSMELYEETKETITEQWENYDSSEDEDTNESGASIPENDELEPEISTSSYDNITSLSYQEFTTKIVNAETFVIVISQTSCGHCIAYKPIFNQVLKENNIQGYELDLQTITETEYEDFLNNYTVSGTPTTLIFKNGIAEEEKLVGTKDSAEITTFLQKYNIIQ